MHRNGSSGVEGGEEVTERGQDDRGQNPFDPERLRLSQNFIERTTSRRIVSAVQVRKPNRQEYFRVHPSTELRLEALLLDFKQEGMTYLVDPEIGRALPGEAVAKMLYLAITRQGAILLWPVRLPDEQGNLDHYNASAHRAAMAAETTWVRIAANRGAGAYDIYEALDQASEPEWPEMRLGQLLELAFKTRFIDSLDHPVVRGLLGE